MDEVAARITARRQELGMTKAAVAAAAGIDASYVSHVERGQKPVTMPFVTSVAPALGTTAQWLLFGSEPTAPTIPLDADIEPGGVWAGDLRRWGLGTSDLDFVSARPTEWLATEGAGPGWCASRVADGPPLSVTLDPGTERSVRVDLWPGDVVLWRPVGDEPPRHGDLVVVADGDGLERRVEVRLVRELDGERWAWPLARPQQAPEVLGGWRVLAVAVEQRRELCPW